MIKTLKAIKRWYDGHELEASDWRRIDALWFEVKCVTLTILVVIILLLFLNVVGTFEGTPIYKLKK